MSHQTISGAATPVHITNDSTQPIPTTATLTGTSDVLVTNSDDVEAIPTTISGVVLTTDSSIAARDSFYRFRVSEPYTEFESKQIYKDPTLANNVENYPLVFDNIETSGSGTSTLFNVNRASTSLSVSNITAGTRVRQSFRRMDYQPGKSQQILLTFVMGTTGSGNTKLIGYYDANNGILFKDSGGTLSFVVRSNATGSPVDNSVTQANWNLDKLDGTGSSGLTLDITKTQLMILDFSWLGVGDVRCGFEIGGVPIYCHKFLHSNVLDVVFMSTPNLPIRAEITNDGTGAVDSIEMICSTVISESTQKVPGMIRSNNLGTLGTSEIQASTIDSAYAICGIRLKSAYIGTTIDELSLTMMETTGGSNSYLWRLHLNPTLTSGLTYPANGELNSAVEFGKGLPAGDVLTNLGIILDSGYVAGSVKGLRTELTSALKLGSTIAGVRDQLVLSGTPLTANLDFLGGLTWVESL